MAAVDEEVAGGGAGAEEGTPPPVVVLGAQVEVAEQDGRLGACDHEDDEYQEEEAEHVVHLIRPERVQDEEELDEDTAEGQHSTHDGAGDGLGVK